MNEAIRDWITNVEDTHYLIGSAAGPHPYPVLVRELQSVIGREAREQVLAAEGRLPDLVVACVGGGSNAIGLFHPFIDDADVRLLGAEAGGDEQRHGGDAVGGPGVGAARLEELRAGRRGRPGAGDALDLGRARLPGRRPGARVAEGHRPRRVRAGHRCAGAGGVPPAVHARGHHPGARVGARAVAGAAAGAGRAGRGGGPVRPRRQGRGRGRGAGVAAREDRDAGAGHLPDGRPRHGRAGRGGGARRRHGDRDRHPLLRPAGGRPDRPAGRAAGAAKRDDGDAGAGG